MATQLPDNPWQGVQAPEIHFHFTDSPFFRDFFGQIFDALFKGVILENMPWLLFAVALLCALIFGPKLIQLMRFGRGVTENEHKQLQWKM